MDRPLPHTLIIGGGPGGMCIAIKLQERGLPFTILERSDGFGGVWRVNTYPGCGCDVPSIFYHFSFMPKMNWSQKWAKQPEILEYFESVGAKYGLAACTRFETEAEEARFDAAACVWTVRARSVSDGTFEEFKADIVVSSMGQLSRPFIPHIDGLETFQGPTFHANKWDHSTVFSGKRVAVIGTGATAIQFVPHVVKEAAHVTIFQRSPAHYVCGPASENAQVSSFSKWILSNVPRAGSLQRLNAFLQIELMGLLLGTEIFRRVLERGMKKLVKDDALRDRLTPEHLPGCKRVLIGESNNYLRALQEPHVKLDSTAIKRIVPQGIETQDGLSPFDVIVLSTGFQTQDFLSPLSVIADSSDLRDVWGRTPRAHYGMAVAGFPNFFLMYGPNTNTGAGSILFFLECQANYITQLVSRLHTQGFGSVAVREDAMDRFNNKMQDDMKKSVFATGCGSWYVNADGVVTTNWPGTMTSYWRQTRAPDPTEYIWSKSEARPSHPVSRM